MKWIAWDINCGSHISQFIKKQRGASTGSHWELLPRVAPDGWKERHTSGPLEYSEIVLAFDLYSKLFNDASCSENKIVQNLWDFLIKVLNNVLCSFLWIVYGQNFWIAEISLVAKSRDMTELLHNSHLDIWLGSWTTWVDVIMVRADVTARRVGPW